MAYEDPQLVHEDQFLTAISVAYDNDNEYIGDRLFPTVRVQKQSDKYRVYTKDNAARVTDDHRSPGSRSNELPPMMLPSKDTYFATEHALKDVIPVEEEQNADPDINPQAEATERLTDTILLNREYSLIQMVTTAANYATGHSTALAGTAQWNDHVNSNPITNVRTARYAMRGSMSRNINTAIFGWEVLWQLEDHPDITDRFASTQLQLTNEQIIAQILRIPNILVAQAEYNTAPYGEAENMVDLWGKHVLFAWVPNRPAQRTPAFGYEFAWPFSNGQVMVTERRFDDDRKADIVEVRRRYDQKFVAVDNAGKSIGGYLIRDAVA